MQYKLNKILVLTFVSLTLVFFIGTSAYAQAAEMFFATSTKTAADELLEVNLFLNTKEESINAVAGKVIFSSDILSLEGIEDGNSLVNFWIEKPVLQTKGEIIFSGITPGGYKGSKGLLFSLIFRVIKPGAANIKLAQAQALLNDGKGTEAKLTTPLFILKNLTKNDNEPAYIIEDQIPPQTVNAEISQHSSIEEGKWFILFGSQDKESGIDHYEVQESLNKKPSDSDWNIASSPYILQDQTLKSFIYIKAVDRAGNSTITVLNPKKVNFSYIKILVTAFILAIIFVFILVRKFLLR